MTSEDIKFDRRPFVAYYKKASQKRFIKAKQGYSFDRWLFQATMWMCFAYLWFVAQSYQYDIDFYQCESGNIYYTTSEMCHNPFYKPGQAWKGQEYLPPGEYGTKPGKLFWSVQYVPLILFGIAGLLNHFFHNRKVTK